MRELGAEVRVCAPPGEEFAVLLAGVGVPLVPFGPSVRALVTGVTPPSAADAFRLAAELVAVRFVRSGEDVRWWTWVGYRANATLAATCRS